MVRFLWAHIVRRRVRSGVLCLGILVAAMSFSLLTSATQTSSIRTRGTLQHNFRSAYDLLIRPTGTVTAAERAQGLVSDNFQSGIYGGITERQRRSVLAIPGVEVAAPVANIGYLLTIQSFRLPLSRLGPLKPDTLYRLDLDHHADNGMSHYAGRRLYLYMAGNPKECSSVNVIEPPELIDTPFGVTSDRSAYSDCHPIHNDPHPYVSFDAQFTFLVAAIDPTEENKLIHLDRAMVRGSGTGLVSGLGAPENRFNGATVPVIASTRTYVDEPSVIAVNRVNLPPGVRAFAVVGGPAGSTPLASSGEPTGPNVAYRRAMALPVSRLSTVVTSSQELYGHVLGQLGSPENGVMTEAFWQTGPAHYTAERGGTLAVVGRPALSNNDFRLNTGYYPVVSQANRDTQFRHITIHRHAVRPDGVGFTDLGLAGLFDPTKLPGFDPVSRVPLESYYPPVAVGADAQSRAALGSKPLRPSTNLGGYLAQPPFLLTTLQAADGFLNPRYSEGANAKAPISVIRVKVSGVTGPDRLSLARLDRVAAQIHDKTGLSVDVTAGSSPQPQHIFLPAGKFGRPALNLQEGWTKKGVAVVILRALDRKSLALLCLVLVITILFLGNASFSSVRSRRSEIATMMCLGWPRWRIFGAALAELGIVGALAGVLGTALAAGLIVVLHLSQPLAVTLLIAPVALTIALVAGLIPAAMAARGQPIDALRQVTAGGRRHRLVRGPASMGLVNVRRVPGRTAVAAVALAVGTASLASLVALSIAFRGSVSGSLLGNVVSLQARPVDYLSVVLAIALAGISLSDVLILGVRERAAEFVTLRTVGWSDGQLARLVTSESVAVALLGSVPGAAVGVLIGQALGAPAGALVQVALLTLLVGLFVCVLASAIPVVVASRMSVAVLAED